MFFTYVITIIIKNVIHAKDELNLFIVISIVASQIIKAIYEKEFKQNMPFIYYSIFMICNLAIIVMFICYRCHINNINIVNPGAALIVASIVVGIYYNSDKVNKVVATCESIEKRPDISEFRDIMREHDKVKIALKKQAKFSLKLLFAILITGLGGFLLSYFAKIHFAFIFLLIWWTILLIHIAWIIFCEKKYKQSPEYKAYIQSSAYKEYMDKKKDFFQRRREFNKNNISKIKRTKIMAIKQKIGMFLVLAWLGEGIIGALIVITEPNRPHYIPLIINFILFALSLFLLRSTGKEVAKYNKNLDDLDITKNN